MTPSRKEYIVGLVSDQFLQMKDTILSLRAEELVFALEAMKAGIQAVIDAESDTTKNQKDLN